LHRGNLVSGIVLAGLGVYIVMQARGWDYLGQDGPGPGFFPLWYGVAMIALSLALVVQSLRTSPDGEGKPVKWREVGRVFIVWLAFVACVASLKFLGFVPGFALFVLFLVRGIYARPWPAALAVAIGCAAGFYLLFAVALGVRLPAGWLGI
jgi:putative tricarboxylic transport membrane protein